MKTRKNSERKNKQNHLTGRGRGQTRRTDAELVFVQSACMHTCFCMHPTENFKPRHRHHFEIVRTPVIKIWSSHTCCMQNKHRVRRWHGQARLRKVPGCVNLTWLEFLGENQNGDRTYRPTNQPIMDRHFFSLRGLGLQLCPLKTFLGVLTLGGQYTFQRAECFIVCIIC